jgi:uncharacterized PurR-regulated membrane protein YhhQ (DUF165 family)
MNNMKKAYSKKEREARRLVRNVFVGLIVVVLLLTIVILTTSNNEVRQYTAEEMLHDHDGDGIPDH